MIIDAAAVGVFPFVAPEIFVHQKYSKASDVYAFAIIVYEIMTGKYPYRDMDDSDIKHKISFKKKRPEFNKDIPEVFKNLIKSCWCQKPGKRLTFDQIIYQLKTNRDFITEKVDEKKYRLFIEYIDNRQNGIESTLNIAKIFSETKQNSILERLEKIKENENKQEIKEIIRLLPIKEIDWNQFEIIAFVNRAGFGKIFKIKRKGKNDFFAAKILFKNKASKIDFLRELAIQSSANHPLIAKIIGYSFQDFKGKSKFVMISEFINNGSLENILNEERKNNIPKEIWNNTMKLINIYGIASAISYLHSRNIIHNDIKPGNVLVDDFIFPKICDFGLSKNENQKNEQEHVGTAPFMAPEIFNDCIYSKKSDIYAFGMLLYEMKTNKYPFAGLSYCTIMYKVAIQDERPKLDKSVPKIYQDLIKSCWNKQYDERPDIDKIVDNLKTDKGFIEGDVDENIYHSFIDIIDKQLENNDTISIINDTFHRFNIKAELNIDDSNNYSSVIKSDVAISFNDIDKESKIFENEESQIYKLNDNGKPYTVSVSKFSIDILSQEEQSSLLSKVDNFMKLNHSSIQKFCGINLTQKKQIIINEYCNSKTLHSVIKQHNKSLTPTKKLILIYGIASGMKYLHSHSILYPILNTKNIIVDSNFHPKISLNDEIYQTLKNANKSKLTSNKCDKSFYYLSPEKLQLKETNEKGDVYSFSLVVYEIVSNESPFKNQSKHIDLIKKIINDHFRPKLNESIPNAYKNLIECCWSENQDDRPSFSQIVSKLESDQEFVLPDINKIEYDKYKQCINSK